MDKKPENNNPKSTNCGGYEEQSANVQALQTLLGYDPNSPGFTSFVYRVASEIKRLCQLKKKINFVSNSEEYKHFIVELISFLKELGCPHKRLITDVISLHLQTKYGRLLLVEYLMFALLNARVINTNCLQDNHVARLELAEEFSLAFNGMKNIHLALKLNQYPPSVTPEMFYLMLEIYIKYLDQKETVQVVNKLLLPKHYKSLENYFNNRYEEYIDIRENLIYHLSFIIENLASPAPHDLGNEAGDCGLNAFEEAIVKAQKFKKSEFLTLRMALVDFKNNFNSDIVNNNQNAMAIRNHPLGMLHAKPKPKLVADTAQVEHEPHGEGVRSEGFNKEKPKYNMCAPGTSGTQKNQGNYRNRNSDGVAQITEDTENKLKEERVIGRQKGGKDHSKDMFEASHVNNKKKGSKFRLGDDSCDEELLAELGNRFSHLKIDTGKEDSVRQNDWGSSSNSSNSSMVACYNIATAPVAARRGRGRGSNRGSTRGSRGSRHYDFNCRGIFEYIYSAHRHVAFPTRFRNNRDFGAGVAYGRALPIPFNMFHQNIQNQQFLPMIYLHASEIRVFLRHNTIILKINDVFVFY